MSSAAVRAQQLPETSSAQDVLGVACAVLRDARGRVIQAVGRVAKLAPVPDEASLEAVLLGVTRALAVPLGVRPEDLAAVGQRRVADLWSVTLEQRREGVPVLGSRVELRITGAGTLVALRARSLVGGAFAGTWRLSREEALELARLAVPAAPEVTRAFDARAAWSARGAPEDAARSAWSVEVRGPAPEEAWRVVLDAETGEVREVLRSVVEDVSGQVRGRGVEGGPSTTHAPEVQPLVNLWVVGKDLGGTEEITSGGARHRQSVVSGDGTRVAFVTDEDGDDELWVMNADGTGLTRLTANSVPDHSPSISDDGARIAFVSELGGDPEIWIVNGDGTGLAPLTDDAAVDRSPSLSDDGNLVAWTSNADGDFEILLASTWGGSPVQLTSNGASDVDPALAGDGSAVAYACDLDGDHDLWIVQSDGSGARALTFNAVEDRHPSIQDDGARIVFESGERPLPLPPFGSPKAKKGSAKDADTDLWLVRSDGGGLTLLASGPGNQAEPCLSGDGSCLAFSDDADGDTEVFLLELATAGLEQLSDDGDPDGQPSLSDDGEIVVWTSGDDPSQVTRSIRVQGLTTWDTLTSGSGAYSLPVPAGDSVEVRSRLRGAHVTVRDVSGLEENLCETSQVIAPAAGVDQLQNPFGADELPTAQVTAYRQVESVHEYLSTVYQRPPLSLPTPLPIDFPLDVQVNARPHVHNAFYSWAPRAIQCFVGNGGALPNSAYHTILYHEYGHCLDDAFGGLIGGIPTFENPFALTEGLGDVLALLASGQSVVGEDWNGPGTWLRDYGQSIAAGGSADRQVLGEDCLPDPWGQGVAEPHDHGQAFAGFAWDVRARLGVPLAEDLLLGAIALDPGNMPAAVLDVFLLDDTPAFGGDGDPSNGTPHGADLCWAAAAHGFDCLPQPDFGGLLCTIGICPVTAQHLSTGTEWLGASVNSEWDCEPGDSDGVTIAGPPKGGATSAITVTITADPALQSTGRWNPAFPTRLVYLNGWLNTEDFGAQKMIGTGSPLGTVAFDPSTFAPGPNGLEAQFTFLFTWPVVPEQIPGVLRFRLDYGEDCGWTTLSSVNWLANPLLWEQCGPARFGEVEDVWISIMP